MMQMNSGIILAGQQPDILGILDRSNTAAQSQVMSQRQNALAQLYQTQGPGIAAGDPGALNALARFDPQAAMGVQQSQQAMAFDQEKMQMARDEAKRAAEEWAAGKSAAEIKAQRDKLAEELRPAIVLHAQGKRAEFDAYVRSHGLDPNEYSFEHFPAMIAAVDGAFEFWDSVKPEAPKPAEPFTLNPGDVRFGGDGKPIASVPAKPEGAFRNASPQEAAQYGATAGQFGPDGRFYPINPPSGMSITTNPDGTMSLVQGPGASNGAGGDASTRSGQVFDEMKASADAARAAASGLKALKEASSALSGGTITGFAANQRLAAAKLGALFGIGDPKVIENTETFRAAIAPQVAAMMKATVGSTQISNADREFAAKAAGGDITLDEASIARLLDVMERASKAIIDAHSRKLDAVYPPGSADRERALFSIDPSLLPTETPPTEQQPAPQSGPPAGVTQEEWDALTPDEKAMWNE